MRFPRLGTLFLVAALSVLALCLFRFSGMPGKNKSFVWQTASPESQGMIRAKLNDVEQILESRMTKAFLVQRHGQIVYEWYGVGHGRTQQFDPYSLAKALVGGMSLLVALGDRRMGLDDPV